MCNGRGHTISTSYEEDYVGRRTYVNKKLPCTKCPISIVGGENVPPPADQPDYPKLEIMQ